MNRSQQERLGIVTSSDGADLAERLVAICGDLATDEMRVLVLVAERFSTGRRQYGELQVAGGWDFVGIGLTNVVSLQMANHGSAPAAREELRQCLLLSNHFPAGRVLK